MVRRALITALALLAQAALAMGPETNFSQHPGFAAYFAGRPPAAAPPNAAERALIARYRPRVFVPEGHPGPIDFYRDYIAHGVLRDGEGRRVSAAVTPAVLNAYRGAPRAEFRHAPPAAAPRAVVYGRIDRAGPGVPGLEGEFAAPFVCLTYHLVFRHSGLPEGLKGWKALLAGLAGDADDWHQLDHYTAVTVVLGAEGMPVAVMFQQHNYLRTYLVGEGIELPPDGRVRVDVALRSNELYPHRPGRTVRRAVRFARGESMDYLLGFGERPLLAADDITDSARELDPALEFLAPSDAFYMFQGFLGERRLLPGRSGPPGASYNTLPALKPLRLQLLSGYWRQGHPGDRERHRAARERGPGDFAAAQAPVFAHNLRCLGRGRAGCRLR